MLHSCLQHLHFCCSNKHHENSRVCCQSMGEVMSNLCDPNFIYLYSYMETRGENATIKPWLWVLLFFVGAIVNSVLQHWELYIQTVVLVRAQALLTHLVFEHSLRIRLKAETSGDAPVSRPITPSAASITGEQDEEPTIITGSIPEDDDGETSSSTAALSQEANQATDMASNKGKAKAVPEGEEAKNHNGDTENLTGRINNLVTSDLASIINGTDFLSFSKYLRPVVCGLMLTRQTKPLLFLSRYVCL